MDEALRVFLGRFVCTTGKEGAGKGFSRTTCEDAPVGSHKDAEYVEFVFGNKGILRAFVGVDKFHRIEGKWGIHGGKRDMLDAFAETAPELRSIDLDSRRGVVDGESDDEEFRVVGTTIVGLIEEQFELGDKPSFNDVGRVNAETIIDVETLNDEVAITTEGSPW